MATQVNSSDSKSKCSDTTDGNTRNTSARNRKPKPGGGLQTEPKQQEQGETLSEEKSPRLAVAYKEFLITDLKLWTFKMRDVNDQEHECTARNCPAEHWIHFFSEYANLDPAADWTDLEERADFLTQLWSFCYQHALSFPLTENVNAG